MDDNLLRRIDDDEESRKKGRSAFLRSAVSFYLAAKRRKEVDDQIARAYEGEADALLDEIEPLMELQAWPRK